jgi:hypothetical protein
MMVMAAPPESTKDSLRYRLVAHARARWPQVTSLDVRYRGQFAYAQAHLPDGTIQPLIRLRYSGSARHWGFGLYLASSDRYEDQILPSGLPIGSPEEALDCACGLYFRDPV